MCSITLKLWHCVLLAQLFIFVSNVSINILIKSCLLVQLPQCQKGFQANIPVKSYSLPVLTEGGNPCGLKSVPFYVCNKNPNLNLKLLYDCLRLQSQYN